MSARMAGRLLAGCIAWAVAGTTIVAAAQPEADQRVQGEPVVAAAPESAEEARANSLRRLENRLNWTRRMMQKFAESEARIVQAQERIGRGENPEAVMQELRRQDAPNLRIRISNQDGDEREEPGEGRRRPRGFGEFPPATPEQKERIDRVLEVIVPGLADHLKQICETEGERCDREYARLADRMHDLIQDGVSDEALFQLRLDEMRVSAQVVIAARRQDGLLDRKERLSGSGQQASKELLAEIAEAEQSLEALIGEQFDVRLRIREEERAKLQRELEKIQRQIADLDATIVRHRQDRERIVDEQAAEALEQARGGRERPHDAPPREPRRGDPARQPPR